MKSHSPHPCATANCPCRICLACHGHIYSSSEAVNAVSDSAHGGKKQMACHCQLGQRVNKMRPGPKPKWRTA